MVFITGPRQVGKTYLAKQVMAEFHTPQYLNYDNINDVPLIQKMSWAHNADLIVFDEIHKMKNWKNYLKGVYDSKERHQSILVTGSARLDTFRQTGDSLAGRYAHLRLLPFSVKEIISENISAYDAVELLTAFGGFPEPLLNGTTMEKEKARTESARWHNQYFTDIIREDIVEFSRIHEVRTMKLLLQLLRSRVGSPLSYNALAGDLQVSTNTIKKYIQILEGLYIIFLIYPFHKNIARSLLKEPKIYFYDTAFIEGDNGTKLENMCAVCLLKHTHFLYDVEGKNSSLHYLKTKEKKEVDFVLVDEDEPTHFIEVKQSDNDVSRPLRYFSERFKNVTPVQLVHNLRQNETVHGISITKAGEWLAELAV